MENIKVEKQKELHLHSRPVIISLKMGITISYFLRIDDIMFVKHLDQSWHMPY